MGEPHLRLAGLSLWVHGRQFPNDQGSWDGNWLNMTAHCKAEGAQVELSEPMLMTSDLENWRKSLRQLYDTLEGEARLDPMEPYLAVALKAKGKGHIDMAVEISPDHLNQRHQFKFELDQSYLSSLIRQLDQILEQYPVRGES